MRQMTHQNFGVKIYRTDGVLTEKACLENRVGLRRGMANTVLIKMQCTRLTPAAAGAVMCALGASATVGKVRIATPRSFS
jgi:hypothetical protein